MRAFKAEARALSSLSVGVECQLVNTRTHEWIDQRSLALDRAVAEKLRAEPALLDRARKTLERWLQRREPAIPPVFCEWREILADWPVGQILELLTSGDENARRLRQSSPFCGILSPAERLAILREYESRRQRHYRRQ